MRRNLSCTVAVVLAVCLFSPATAAASPAWVAQGNLSNPQTEIADTPAVALDRGGDATTGWIDSVGSVGALLASSRPAGGLWGTPNQLSGLVDDFNKVRSIGPQIVDSGDGDASAVWGQAVGMSTSAVEVSLKARSGIWGAPEVVSPTTADATDPVIAMSSVGMLLAAWSQGGVIVARTRAPSGTWSPPAPLGPGSRPGVAINARGDLVTVWTTTDPMGQSSSVLASVKRADTDWSLPQTVASYPSDAGAFIDPPRVALDQDGEATAVWDLYFSFLLEAATRPPGGPWSSPVTLTHNGEFADVAYDASGNATASWSTGGGGFVQTARRPRDASWLPVTTLSEAHTATSESRPALAVNAAGQAVVAWRRDSDPFFGGPATFAAVSDAQGAWGPATKLSDSGTGSVKAAIDDSGDALVTWSQSNTIKAAAYDQSGPSLLGLTIPSAVAGSMLRVRVAPVDTWTAVASVTWDFGDGVAADGFTAAHAYSAAGHYVIGVTARDALGNVSRRAVPIEVSNAPPPTVTTGGARSVGRTFATITATVSPDGASTTSHFDWGRTRSYGHRTSEIFVGSDTARHVVIAKLRGLRQGKTYHYRIAARCPQICGYVTAHGFDGAFATLPPRSVTATFAYDGFWQPRYSIFTNLTIKGIPRGSKLEFLCAGRRCPFKRETFRARGQVNLATRLKRRRLPVGTRLEARVLKARWTGKVFVFRTRPSRKPLVSVLCLPPGAHRLRGC
jgi:hypothetical protein